VSHWTGQCVTGQCVTLWTGQCTSDGRLGLYVSARGGLELIDMSSGHVVRTLIGRVAEGVFTTQTMFTSNNTHVVHFHSGRSSVRVFRVADGKLVRNHACSCTLVEIIAHVSQVISTRRCLVNLECRPEMCCTWLAENTGRKKVAKNRHLCICAVYVPSNDNIQEGQHPLTGQRAATCFQWGRSLCVRISRERSYPLPIY